MKKRKLTPEHRFEVVQGLYLGWRTRKYQLFHPEEELLGNRERLAHLIGMKKGEDFKSDKDLKRKVESWIEEKEESFKTQEEKRERYKKARFKKKLFEACLSRYKK